MTICLSHFLALLAFIELLITAEVLIVAWGRFERVRARIPWGIRRHILKITQARLGEDLRLAMQFKQAVHPLIHSYH